MSRGCKQMLAVTAALGALLAGCAQEAPHQGLPPNVTMLTPGDITRFPAGSPTRGLLEWWRSVQYGSLVGYLSFLSPRLAATELRQGTALGNMTLLSGALQPTQPRILSSDVHGRTATVYTRVYTRQPVGNTRFVAVSAPQAFSMVQSQGRWLLTDDYFIRQQVQLLRQGIERQTGR